MSELVSLYDVIFGTRAIKGTEDGSLRVSYDLRNKEEPVDITRVACAVEDESVKSYCFDKFGRFGIATVETKEKAKLFLASYHNILLSNIDPSEAVEYEESLSDVHDTSEWHYFGWMADELPDFEACYENWKVENGMKGKTAPPMKTPAAQSHFWKLTGKLLKTVIGEDAYNTVLKGDYTKAVSALQNHKNKEFRYSDNEKKALRENLKKIVTNAPFSEM
jgi:hypothetical protein